MEFERVEEKSMRERFPHYKQLTCETCKSVAAGTESQLKDWANRHEMHFNHTVQEDSK